MYGQTVSIKGNGAEHVGGVEGAVDRVADEILRRLEKGRTLVVWAFDASGSLVAERERLAKHIETVYTHITQLDEKEPRRRRRPADGGRRLRPGPQGDDRRPDRRQRRRSSAPSAPSRSTRPGVETTFQTVAEIVRKWGRYKDAKGNAYQTMVIVVTDEVGDDEDHLEEAIDVATEAKVPVYVLGSQAIFGRVEGQHGLHRPQDQADLPQPPGPPGARERHARADPPAVLVRRRPVRHPRLGVRPLRPEPPGRGDRGDLLRHPAGPDRGWGSTRSRCSEYKPDWVSPAQYEAERPAATRSARRSSRPR